MNTLKMKEILTRLSRVLALLFIFIALSILVDNFLEPKNLLNILNQASLNTMIAIGLTFTMLVSGIDLSAGSILALTSVLAATFFRADSVPSMALGIIIALSLGAFLGAINGTVVSYLSLPPFLVTFGMQQIARGVAYLYMSGNVFNNFDQRYLFIGKGDVLGIPMPVIIATVAVIIASLLLSKTTIGRKIYSVGANRSAAQYSGISTHKTTIFAFAASGFMAALAGLVYISRLNAAEAIIGENFSQQAIAAAAIGGISFKGGRGSVYGTVVGALILASILNGMNQLGIPTQYQNLVTGTAIIIAVLLDRTSARVEL